MSNIKELSGICDYKCISSSGNYLEGIALNNNTTAVYAVRTLCKGDPNQSGWWVLQ